MFIDNNITSIIDYTDNIIFNINDNDASTSTCKWSGTVAEILEIEEQLSGSNILKDDSFAEFDPEAKLDYDDSDDAVVERIERLQKIGKSLVYMHRSVITQSENFLYGIEQYHLSFKSYPVTLNLRDPNLPKLVLPVELQAIFENDHEKYMNILRNNIFQIHYFYHKIISYSDKYFSSEDDTTYEYMTGKRTRSYRNSTIVDFDLMAETDDGYHFEILAAQYFSLVANYYFLISAFYYNSGENEGSAKLV